MINVMTINTSSLTAGVIDENTSFQKNIVPANKVPLKFKMKIEEQKRKVALAESKNSGKTPKDIEWDMFVSSKMKMNDDEIAIQHLDKYIDICATEGINVENLCYEMFLDFSKGRKNIKSDFLAENMIPKFSNTRDVNKLKVLTNFYELNHEYNKAEGFYYTLYQIFANAEGVAKDLIQAAKYLKSAINITNTPDRRMELRIIYEEQSANLPEERRTCKAYEKIISDNIKFAKTDYAFYLKAHDKRLEAMRYFIADGEFAEAYEVINIRVKSEIDETLEEMKKGGADSEFAFSLNAMKNNFETLQNIFTFQETPLTFWGMAWRYTMFGPIYAIYHTIKLNLKAFIIALVFTIALTFAGIFSGHGGAAFTFALLSWTISTLVADIARRNKFISCCKLWTKLYPHSKLAEKNNIFANSQKIINYSPKSWTLVIPILWWLFVALIFIVAFEDETVRQKNPPATQITNDEQNLDSEDIPKASERDQRQVKEEIDRDISPEVNQSSHKVQVTTPPSNPLLTNTDFGMAFNNYYKSINDKQFGQAYSYLTEKCRRRMGSLANFAEGRKNTLSVEVIDFQPIAASSNQVNCTYVVRANDGTPNGVLVQDFSGNVTLVRMGNQWFIDEIASSLTDSHIE